MMQNDRAARFLVQFYDVVCQTKTRNFHTDISQQHELAAVNLSFLLENQLYQSSERTLRLFFVHMTNMEKSHST